MKKALILAIIWLSAISLALAQDVNYSLSGKATEQETSFKVLVKIHNPDKQIAGIQARLTLPQGLDIVGTRPLNPDGSQASNKMTFAGQPQVVDGVSTRVLAYLAVGDQLAPNVTDFDFFEITLKLHDNTALVAGQEFTIKLDQFKTSDRNQTQITSNSETSVTVVVTSKSNPPEYRTVVFSGISDYTVNVSSSQFTTKLLLANPATLIDSIIFELEYSDPQGLAYSLNNLVTRNPDGSIAGNNVLISKNLLENSGTKQRWQIIYVAKNGLAPAMPFSFLVMTFSLTPNHYQAGDILNLTIKNITVKPHDKQIVMNPIAGVAISVKINGVITEPNKDSVAFSLKQGYRINIDQNQCPQFLGKMTITNSKKKLLDSIVMEFAYQDPNGLKYELYGAGTRYPDGADASVKYWTWLSDMEKSSTVRRQKLILTTSDQPLSDDLGIELYFKFTSKHNYRPGDTILIKLTVTKIVARNQNEAIGFNQNVWLPIVFESNFTTVTDKQSTIDYLNCWPSLIADYAKVTYKSLSAANLSLYNSQGTLLNNLGKADGEGTKVLNLREFPAGMYFIIMTSTSEQKLFKIIKQ